MSTCATTFCGPFGSVDSPGQAVSPYYFTLVRQPWQLFVTLTFDDPVPSEWRRLAMFHALLRRVARREHAHLNGLLWCLREENGGRFGRVHFHFLLMGLPDNRLGGAVCRRLVTEWKHFRGGQADVRVYDPTLDGVRYVLKISPQDANNLDGRESAKFGPNDCKLVLGNALKVALGIEH